eukprot:1434751-Lingulodinium_polyedra.AAC.1
MAHVEHDKWRQGARSLPTDVSPERGLSDGLPNSWSAVVAQRLVGLSFASQGGSRSLLASL